MSKELLRCTLMVLVILSMVTSLGPEQSWASPAHDDSSSTHDVSFAGSYPSGVTRLPFVGTHPISQGPQETKCSSLISHYKGASNAYNKRAIDFPMPNGTAVLAAGSGSVVYTGSDSGGKYVIISHNGDTSRTGYWHLSAVGVSVGASVYAGQEIGKSGTPPGESAYHLHFASVTGPFAAGSVYSGAAADVTGLPGLTWFDRPGDTPTPIVWTSDRYISTASCTARNGYNDGTATGPAVATPADLRQEGSVSVSSNPTVDAATTFSLSIRNYGGTASAGFCPYLEFNGPSGAFERSYATSINGVGSCNNHTIAAGQTRTYTITASFHTVGSWSGYGIYMHNGTDYLGRIGDANPRVTFGVTQPCGADMLRVSSSVYLNPTSADNETTVSAGYSVTNTGSCSVSLLALGLAGRGTDINDIQDFPFTGPIVIGAGQTYIFTTQRAFPVGPKNFWASTHVEGDWWLTIASNGSAATTAAMTITQAPTKTFTPTSTPSSTSTPSATSTATVTPSLTYTATPSQTPTHTPTNTATASTTPSQTATVTNTPQVPTNTFAPQVPTSTWTPVVITATFTPQVPTSTFTPVVITATFTPQAPTSTFTPVVVTSTFTPQVPTLTNTPQIPTITTTPKPSATPRSAAPKVVLDKTKSKFNGWVTASFLGFTPGGIVTLRWSDGTVLGQAAASESGTGAIRFRTPLVALGDYLVEASNNFGQAASSNFRVIPRIMIAPDDHGPVGTMFRIYLYGFSPGERVDIKFFASDGQSSQVLATVTIASNGRARTDRLYIPNGTTLGDHKIVGDVIGVARSASLFFEVTRAAASRAEEPSATPSPTTTTTPELLATITPITTQTATTTPVPTDTPVIDPTATETAPPVDTATPEPTATESPTEAPTATEFPPVDPSTPEAPASATHRLLTWRRAA